MNKIKIPLQTIITFLGVNVLEVKGPVDDVFVDNIADVAHTIESTLDWVNPVKKNKQQMAFNQRGGTV